MTAASSLRMPPKFAGSVRITMASDGRPLIEGDGLALEIAEGDVAVLIGMLSALGLDPFAGPRDRLAELYALAERGANTAAKLVAGWRG